MSRQSIACLAALVMLSAAGVFAKGEATTAPAATTQAAAEVSPDAKRVLDSVSSAYAKLKSLSMDGTITGEFDVDGQKGNESASFTTNFAAPNKFKHETKEDGSVLGSTGERLYVYAKARNAYLTADAPKKVMSDQLPEPFAQLIGSQNLSLVLALSSEPTNELTRSYSKIDKSADVQVDGKSFTALNLKPRQGAAATTLLFDPATNLLRRATMNMADELVARGAKDVKKAVITIDYKASMPDADAKPEQFAWTPPPTAKDAKEMAEGGEEDEASKALTGKPAPDFKLKGLDDKEVALKDLKGKVVVLDFWATWCGPCVGSLPHIDKIASEMKEKGVNVFAVNQAEDKELVQGFMKSKGLTVPVLLDSDSKVGESYKANAIPETVVIGKDGIVRKVFVGAGPDTETKLREAIEEAVKATK